MEINNGFNNALTGIRRGMEGLDRNAAEVASASAGEGGDVVAPLVESRSNALQVEANTRVLRTLDEVLGTLIDEKA
jgi:hypothetical protein